MGGAKLRIFPRGRGIKTNSRPKLIAKQKIILIYTAYISRIHLTERAFYHAGDEILLFQVRLVEAI